MRVEVYDGIGMNGNLIYSSNNLSLHAGLTDGEVNVQDEAIRRRFSLQYTDPLGELTPGVATDIFTTYGHIVKLYRGIYITSPTVPEEVPLGVFGLDNVAVDDTGVSLVITIDGYDLADIVSRSLLVQDFPIAAGTNFGDAIQSLLAFSVAGLTFNFISTTYTTPALLWATGQDPWVAARTMAAAIGCEIFFNPDGVCVMQAIPDYSSLASVWDYHEGADSTILSVNKQQTNRDTYNYYIVTGEHSTNTAPVRGEAFDDNPASPTYYKGSYGRVPAPVESSKLVTTTNQANEAASALLHQSIGQGDRLHFNAIVNPAHEVNDVISFRRSKSKIDGKYVIDTFAIPLTHNRAMDVTTRARQPVT